MSYPVSVTGLAVCGVFCSSFLFHTADIHEKDASCLRKVSSHMLSMCPIGDRSYIGCTVYKYNFV